MAEADLTPEQREYTELLARYNDELRRFGAASPETRAAIMAGGEKTAKRLDFYAQSAANALGGLASGAGSVVKALYSGETGMKQFDGMIDGVGKAAGEASKALQVAGGPIGKVAAVVLKFVELLTGPAKAITEMADKYYHSYQQLAKSGAAAADGMMGVGNDALKMGLVLKDMDSYVQLISANAPDLARLGGSAAQGRRMLSNMGQELEKDRLNFIALGMDMKDVSEGMVGFVKQQNLSGGVASRNTKELAQSARNYILEQDAMTKLTGVSRKEMEEQLASAMREEQFNALIRKTRMEQGDAAADAIINTRKLMENTLGPGAAKGFAAAMTGNLADVEAQKLAMTAGFDNLNAAMHGLKTGLMDPIKATGTVAKGLKRFEETTGGPLALVGANNQRMVAYNEQVKAAMFDEAKATEEMEKIKKLQADAIKNGDKATAEQSKLMLKQLEDAAALQKMMQKGIEPMQKAGLAMADIMNQLVDGLTTLVNWFFKKPKPAPPPPSQFEAKKTADDLTKQAADLQEKIAKGTADDEDKAKFKKLSAEAAQAGAQTIASRENDKRLASLKVKEMAKSGFKITQQDALELIRQEQIAFAEEQAAKKKAEKIAAAGGGGGGGGGGAVAPKEASGGGAAAGGGATAPKEAPAAASGAQAPAAGTAGAAAPTAGAAPGSPGAAAPQTPTSPPPNVKVKSETTVAGVDPKLLGQFYSFAKEWGTELSVNSAVRSDIKQAELFVRAHKYKEPGIYKPALPKDATEVTVRGEKTVVPGSGKGSKHREGQALDIGGEGVIPQRSAIDDALAKFGLFRPHLDKQDPPHIELKQMADGGITQGPSVVGEAGPEAVIPLKYGSVPVDLGAVGDIIKQLKPLADSGEPVQASDDKMVVTVENAIRNLAAQLSQPKPAQVEMLEMLREIKRVNDENMEISGKIARTALN